MNEETERNRSFIIRFVYLCIGLGLYYVFFRYILGAIWPFAVAGFITLLTKTPVDWLNRVLKIPRKGAATFVTLLFYGVVSVLLGLGISRLVNVAIAFIGNMPQIYEAHIQPAVMAVLDWYDEKIQFITPDMEEYLEQVASSILGKLSDVVAAISKWAVSFAQTMAVGVPKAIVDIMFLIIANFFIASDYPRIRSFIMNQFDEKGQKILSDSKRYLFTNFGRMLWSYGLIMCITGCELYVFLKFYQVRNTVAVAVIIAVFDILPVLGVGTIAIPWALVELINGDYMMCLKLLFMYGVITVVRNIIEPKLVGKTVGLHPVTMLISMYCGAEIFGALGIAILPFTLIVVQNLNENGLIDLYKNNNYEEPKGKLRKKLESLLHPGEASK